jgi:hypothetical protein
MPRALLSARLEIVDGQIALAEANIRTQLGAIEEIRRAGLATGCADTYLTILQASLGVLVAERDRLRAQLAALPSADRSTCRAAEEGPFVSQRARAASPGRPAGEADE